MLTFFSVFTVPSAPFLFITQFFPSAHFFLVMVLTFCLVLPFFPRAHFLLAMVLIFLSVLTVFLVPTLSLVPNSSLLVSLAFFLVLLSPYVSLACVLAGRARLQARGALHHVHRRCGQARPGQAAHREGLHGGPVQQDRESPLDFVTAQPLQDVADTNPKQFFPQNFLAVLNGLMHCTWDCLVLFTRYGTVDRLCGGGSRGGLLTAATPTFGP